MHICYKIALVETFSRYLKENKKKKKKKEQECLS